MLPRERRSHTGQGQQMVVGREYTQGLDLLDALQGLRRRSRRWEELDGFGWKATWMLP